MASSGYGFLKGSATAFKVLAWVALIVQAIAGVAALIIGGEPIPTALGITMSPRVAGLLTVIQGGISFFLLTFVSHIVRLLLDIRCSLDKSSSCAS